MTLTLTSSPSLTTSVTLPTPFGQQLGDMDETVLGPEEIDEGPEVHCLDDFARIDHAELRLCDNALNPVHRLFGGLKIDRGDFDRAVIVDVDLAAGDLADLTNDLAAGIRSHRGSCPSARSSS